MNEHSRPPTPLDFSNFLLAAGTLDAASVERAQRAADATGERFDQVLLRLALLSERDLADNLARFVGWPLHRASELPAEPILPERLPARFLRANRVLPVRIENDVLTLAVVDPLDKIPLDAVRLAVEQRVAFRVIAPADFERAVEALYGDETSREPPSPASSDASEHDLERLRDSASEAPVIRLVNQLIGDAVDMRASDIYIEPAVDGLHVRFRVDGMLRKGPDIPARL